MFIEKWAQAVGLAPPLSDWTGGCCLVCVGYSIFTCNFWDVSISGFPTALHKAVSEYLRFSVNHSHLTTLLCAFK